ncbi:hypothetical protein QUA56_08055 [Microcoleus sp. N3A4]|uniref:hypothetical protein n=1 Tax=Microcoleus sp. N3A4 TaxID=3055379 RepID=UPI002FD073B9
MATPKNKVLAATELLLPLEEPSLLFAQRELIRTSGIDFEQWWDEFKFGFIGGKRDKNTNYKTSLWTKPKYVNLTPVNSTSGALTIEYWPDKLQEGNSYLLSGTVGTIINSIMSIMREKSLADSGTSGKGSKPLLRGYPCIKLFFKGDDKIEGVKQIRCVGFTEDAKIAAVSKSIELLKEADINRWAGKIKSIFGDPGYLWQKGISCLSYSGMIARLQGIEGYAFVDKEIDGIALFTAMVSIFERKPDADGFNFSKKTNPNQFSKSKSANSASGETKFVLGKNLAAETKRPVGKCKFVGASLYLDSLKKPIPIVRGNVVLKVNI